MARIRALLVLALLSAGLSAVPADAATRYRGVQIAPLRSAVADPGTIDVQLRAVKAMNARMVRVEAEWARLEPEAAGRRDPAYVALLDRLFAQARQRGVRVLLVFTGSPCWASSAPESAKDGCTGGTDDDAWAPWPPSDPARYASAAAWLAERYAGDLAAIEVWNEPDHEAEDYFKGPEKPARYAAVLRAAYRAIKAADRRVAVLGGSLVGADGRFLQALYRAGIKGSYDGLAVHYYDLVLASLRSIRQVQRRNGDRKPLWLTEFGWTSCAPRRRQEGHACVTRGRQASNLADIFASLRRTRYVRAALVYNLQDTRQYDFGLMTETLRPKPAYRRMRSVLRRPPRRPAAVRLKLRRSGGRIRAAGSGPAGDALELRAYVDGRLRYRATFRLDRRNRFSLRLPRQLGTRRVKVKVFQYWTGRSATRRLR